jgi:VWFA-related protein
MRKLVIAVVVVLAGAITPPVVAQQQPPPKAPEPFFAETIEVRIINVDVVVTDRSGKPVTGLTKNDFELYESGKKREITNFLEMKAPQATAALTVVGQPEPPKPTAQPEAQPDTRSRKIILFIDNSTLQQFNRTRVLDATKDFIKEVIRPTDQIMIVTWGSGLKVRVPFSSDTQVALTAIEAINSTTTMGNLAALDLRSAEQEMRSIPQEYATLALPGQTPPKPDISLGLGVARQYAAKRSHEQHEAAEALKSVIASVRGVEGRKSVVFVSEQLDEIPGQVAFSSLEQLKELYDGGPQTNFASEAQAYRDSELVPSITKLANSTGVTLYPMHAAGAWGDTTPISAENLGMETQMPTRTANPMNNSYLTMQLLARDTGGAALLGSNNFKLAFETVVNDLTTYYSLGFSGSSERKDVVRPLSIKLKNPRGFTVRARRELVEKSLGSEMNDAVSANLFFPISRNDLNIRMLAGEAKAAPEQHLEIVVDVKIPTTSLTLVPEGTDLTGHFSMFVVFNRKDGTVSKVTRFDEPLRFPADSLKRRKEITVRTPVMVDTKTEGISVGVMDDYSHFTGFAMLKVVPAANKGTQ